MKSILFSATALVLSAGAALAGPATIWGVNVAATGSGVSSNAYAERFLLDGTKVQQVLLGAGFSPGGIALVGSTAYVSSTTDNVIRSFNVNTGALGSSITVTGQPAFGSLSVDATGFWANDYGGGNRAYHITFGGVVDRSVVLSLCGSYCNGIEYVQRNGVVASLLANRGEAEPSATYDLYTTTGTVTSTALLANVPNGSGVAYNRDRDQFVVADALNNAVLTYSATGALLATTTLRGTAPDSGFGAGTRFVADLALDVPEPATVALLLTGFGLMGALRRRQG